MSDVEYVVELTPGGQTFNCGADETILDGALRHGIELLYGCRHGRCSTCKYLIEDGEVDFGEVTAYALPDNERDAGWALLCRARPQSDVLIRDHRLPDERALPVLTPASFAGQVAAVTQLTPELWELSVALAAPLHFYAGQFVELGLETAAGTVWRNYSMASPPSSAQLLKFVMKRIAGGAFSGGIDQLQAGQAIAVRGPFGASYLRAGTRPVLLCAIGSGLAPVMAMLRDAGERGDTRRYTFFYGARRAEDLPYLDELRAGFGLALEFVPTLDGLVDGDAWSGATGTVTRAVQHGIENAREFDAYLCGAPPMCETVSRLLSAKGLPAEQLFFDRFFAASA
jgi:propane monooxygenase reductase subunit